MTTLDQGNTRRVASIRRADGGHWVGDGFPVRTLFSYDDGAEDLSPFLLLDYAAPRTFPPTTQRLGVGEHPHRGFETVTIVYSGQVEHRDSTGGGGTIGPGDVQWMTAGGGIVHEEFHGRDYAAEGGPFEMAQLWVNLPRKDKMTPPRYQAITDAQIPAVAVGDGAGSVRVIAGELGGVRGPARTFSRVNVWDVRVGAGRKVVLPVADGDTALLALFAGTLRIGQQQVDAGSLVLLDRAGTAIELEAASDAKVLLLSGEPLGEPVVGQGPFVMSTPQEIRQAMLDYTAGRMGRVR